MVASKKPVGAKTAEQFFSLIKKPGEEEIATKKAVAKGSGEKKTGKKSEKKVSASATTSLPKGTKTSKPESKPADDKKTRSRKAADTESSGKRAEKKPASPPIDRPASAWPLPSSGSDS
jgi:hypothetical protein